MASSGHSENELRIPETALRDSEIALHGTEIGLHDGEIALRGPEIPSWSDKSRSLRSYSDIS
jgi:hypothetical protein